MDFNQIELRRETLFKDAVLASAESRGMDIIANAQKESAQILAEAELACKEAGRTRVSKDLAQAAEREYSAVVQTARRQLLQDRTQMVEALFGEVEQRLEQFAQSAAYPAFLTARAKALAPQLEGCGDARVLVRAADEKHAAAIRKALPGCTVQVGDGIRLGGLVLECGRRRFDETLDAALAEERRRFSRNDKLAL